MKRMRFLHAAVIGLALALLGLAADARAGCGTIVTLNPTSHWAWITIYDVGENIHMDYGWVGPHSARKWTGGASPLPYACGSFYHVRYEVKDWTGKGEPPGGGKNIFDTRMRINPQLVLTDIIQLLQTLGTAISCVTPGVQAGCLAEFGVTEGAQTYLLGAIGSDSNNSVVCLKTSNNVDYWLENSGNCALKPPKGKPHEPKYTMIPDTKRVGIGYNLKFYFFHIYRDGTNDLEVAKKGRFYSDQPGIANFTDPKDGHFHAYKPGTAHVHWDYNNKRQASAIVEVVK